MSPSSSEISAGTRGRVYALIDAFEQDIRAIMDRYLLGEDAFSLGDLHEKAMARKEAEEKSSGTTSPLSHFLDLREAYDLLNRHRELLPSSLSAEIRANTALMDTLVPIRRRVAHARPLAPGDMDSTISILSSFQTQWWRLLHEKQSLLTRDPIWEPAAIPSSDTSLVLHNLPSAEFDETGLVGRTKEVEELVNLLKRGREPIITVIGEGGVGKTALAVQVSYQLVDDPETPYEAIFWASLKTSRLTSAGVHAITGAPQTIVDSLSGIADSLSLDHSPTLSSISSALEGVRALLVIDNLETVGTQEFRELYDALPTSVHFLVTSRIGIGELERRYTLSALTEKDAIELFIAYAKSRRQDFLLSRTRDVKREIVGALRYSPLAIRWYVLSVEAGRDPLLTIRNQRELLKFCVESVYDALDTAGRKVLEALRVLGSAASIDDLILLLDAPSEDVVLAVQELLRSSLVRRERTTDPSELRSLIRVTESAEKFLRTVPTDDDSVRLLSSRHQEIKSSEERRALEASSRSLNPFVIRTRGHLDTAAAYMLRDAIRKSQEQNATGALEQVARAKELDPDFWEVHRVEAYILGYNARLGDADTSFRRALELASASDEAVAAVSHFYAGFLARQIQDTGAAIEYERRSHAYFESAETAHALGNYLVWGELYDEGIALLESASNESDGKLHLIATSAWAEALSRQAEHVSKEFRNSLSASNLAWRGYLVSRSLFEIGVSDSRLIGTAVDCGAIAARQMRIGLQQGISPIEFLIDLPLLFRDAVRFTGADRFSRLRSEVDLLLIQGRERYGSEHSFDLVLDEFGAINSLEGGHCAPGKYVGTIINLHQGYAFIECLEFPQNVFVHSSAFIDGFRLDSLTEGSLVSFNVTQDDQGRDRATEVRPAR